MKKMFFLSVMVNVMVGILALFNPNLLHASECASYPIDAVNPTATSNPAGAGFPGYRGINQLVLYTSKNASRRTGTNEYGVEVLVRTAPFRKQGEIVKITGANTPLHWGEYVISAHGTASRWLLAHGKVGSLVKIETVILADGSWDPPSETKKQILSICQNPQAELVALKSLMQYAKSQGGRLKEQVDYLELSKKGMGLGYYPNPDDMENPLTSQTLEKYLWPSVAPYYWEGSIQGVWHRPTRQNSSESGIQETLHRFKAMGINTVFLETFVHGFPMYSSKVYQKYGITPNAYPHLGVLNGEALLDRWVRLAHAEGMQVHAWCQIFYVGNTALGGESPILKVHPDWANRQRRHAEATVLHPSPIEQGHWFMDPAHPQVRRFILDLTTELATEHAVDGIELDYIRYPASLERQDTDFLASTWGYTPVARAKFTALYGKDPLELTPQDALWKTWESFKAEQVSQVVREIRQAQQGQWQAVREAKGYPELRLSAAVFPDKASAFGIKHQDWAGWMQGNLLDFITPMILSANEAPVCESIRFMQSKNAGMPIVAGLFAPFYKAPTLSSLKQLQASFQCSEEAGYVWFQSDYLKGLLEENLKYRKDNQEPEGC